MATQREVNILIRAQNEASAQLHTIGADLEKIATSARQAGSSTQIASSGLRSMGTAAGMAAREMGSVVSGIGGTVRGLSTFITRLGFTGFGLQLIATQVQHAGQALFGFDANLEQTHVALTTLLGSSEAAGNMLQQLEKFAATTPFDLPGVENATRQLLAFGFQSEQIIPMLTSIGDAVSAMGGGVPEINRVTLALGQMAAAGRVNAQDLMQLTQVGIPAWQILADKIGVTTAQLRDMVQRGAVPAQQAIEALTSGMEERFSGAMEAQSRTMLGIISNIKDSANVALGQIMQPAFEVVKGELQDIQNYLASDAFQEWAVNATAGVEAFSKRVETFIQNDGPQLLDTFKNVAGATLDIGGNLVSVLETANNINNALGGEGWKLLIAAAAGGKYGGIAGALIGVGVAAAAPGVQQAQGTPAKVAAGLGIFPENPVYKAGSAAGQFGSMAAEGTNQIIDATHKLIDYQYQLEQSMGAVIQKQIEYGKQVAAVTGWVESLTKANDLFDSKMAQLDATQQHLSDSQTQLTASTWALLEADAAQVQATQGLIDTMTALSSTYQIALGVQAAYSAQNKEYSALATSIGNAIEIVNNKKAAGLPLTAQENLLLQEGSGLQERLAGGLRDSAEQQGMAAAAAVELMRAQDRVNQMQKEGITTGSDYEQAVKDVQTAQENAKQFGGDPMAASMQSLHDVIQNDLVTAIENLVQKLAELVSPPPIEIQIADAAALQEIQRIKDIIAGGAFMPLSISNNPLTARAGGGTTSRREIAMINEYGPELVVYPYAGAFAAGGTVGIANGGQPGMTVLPTGTQVIPADQTSAILSSLTNGLTPTQAVIDAATSDGKQIAQAMIDGIIAGVSSDAMVPRLTAELLPALMAQREDIRKQLDVARLSGASDEDKAKLMAQMDAITSLIQRWVEKNGTTVDDAINASVDAIRQGDFAQKIADQLAQSEADAFSNFDAIVAGTAIPALQKKIAELTVQRSVDTAAGASQAILDGINSAIQSAIAQLTISQNIYAAADAAGIIQKVIAFTVSDAVLAQLKELEKQMPDAGASLVDAIATGIESGALTIDQAMQILPDNVLPDLQKLEDSLTTQLGVALLSGADNADALQAALAKLDELIKRVEKDAKAAALAIGDVVPSRGTYLGPGSGFSNKPVGSSSSSATSPAHWGGQTQPGTTVNGNVTVNVQHPTSVDSILSSVGITW